MWCQPPLHFRLTRHPERTQQLRLCAEIQAALQHIAAERDLGLHIEQLTEHPPVPMDSQIIAAVQAAAEEAGIAYQPMPSGAGHDAQIMARRCKAGMIFVPSIGGRSHTPAEDTAPAALEIGIRVLAGALYKLAY
ncbi:MAG: M20/M25/M40 family metallo-hydrolase [Caldilineaceae bacterium]